MGKRKTHDSEAGLHNASLFVLNIRSEWSLPSAPAPIRPLADVELHRITFDDLHRQAKQAGITINNHGWFSCATGNDGASYLQWGNLLHAVVDPGARAMNIATAPRSGGRVIADYLLPQLLSFPLISLGLEPLHASAVRIAPDRAVAFLGDSGTGKSTLAAALIAQGCQLLTDDVLALQSTGDGWRVLPGPAQLKLMPRAARDLLSGDYTSRRMNAFTRKRVFDLPEFHHSAQPVRLVGLYITNRAPRTAPALEIVKLTGNTALQILLRHTFNPHGATPARLRRQFELYLDLLASVSIYELRLRSDLAALPRAVTELLDRVRSMTRGGE